MKIIHTLKLTLALFLLLLLNSSLLAQDCNPDVTSPVAICDTEFIINQPVGSDVSISVLTLNDGSYDNCTLASDLHFEVSTNPALSEPPLSNGVLNFNNIQDEPFVVFVWVIDEAGNFDVCSTNVFLNADEADCNSDDTPPVAVCAVDYTITVIVGSDVSILATSLDDGSSDNCTSASNLDFKVTHDPNITEPPLPSALNYNNVSEEGIEHVTFLVVTDEAGNVDVCTTTVFINTGPDPDCNPDVTAPLAVCTGLIHVSTIPEVDFEITMQMITGISTDNCTNFGDLQYFLSTDGSLTSPPSTETLTIPFDSEDLIVHAWVVDEAGNFSSCATTVQFDILQGFHGKVFADSNENCLLDGGEEGLEGFNIRYTLDQGLTYSNVFFPTNALGDYNLFFNWSNSVGEVTVELLMPDGLGNPCVTSYTYDLPFTELQTLDFPVQLATDCNYMYTDISAPFLRRCFPTPYTVSYCNYSTEDVDNVELTVTLDPNMVVEETSFPYTNIGNNQLLFDLQTVAAGECGLIDITVVLDCETTLGATKCVQASITPNDCNEPGANWSGASLVVSGECNEDTGKVNFNITNEGTGTMANPLPFIVVEDVVMYMQTPIQLGPGESESLEFEANGSTWRVAIEQEEGHPSLSSPTAFVEGCGGYGSTGMANQFAMDDVDPFIAIDCQEVIAAFDPNDKRAFPEGYSEQNFIEPNTSIEYNIRFQNTGTDTAFTVRIEDRLSTLLDETSIEAGASSHPYRMEIQEDGLLIFHFENIMLPDSNVNEVASHGFVQFRAQQKPDNDLGLVIENTAEIYFDFNEEIVTNTVFHTLGVNFIVSETNEVFVPNLDLLVAPNPFQSQATFTLKGVDINDGKIELYDVFGRMVKQDTFSGNQYELKRDNLPVGTYLFRFLDANKLLVNGKIVVQ